MRGAAGARVCEAYPASVLGRELSGGWLGLQAEFKLFQEALKVTTFVLSPLSFPWSPLSTLLQRNLSSYLFPLGHLSPLLQLTLLSALLAC